MTESRAQATERVTCQAAAWLWHARKCRAIAMEAGLSRHGDITTPWHGTWRADLVAASVSGRTVRTFVVEVKSTRADLAREHVAQTRVHSKWHHADFAKRHELWVACGNVATGWLAVGDCPEHWGVVVFTEDGQTQVLRKIAEPARCDIGDPHIAGTFLALAEVQTSGAMPRFFNARRRRDGQAPWQRLMTEEWAKDRLWTRDNEQMEMFEHGQGHQEKAR